MDVPDAVLKEKGGYWNVLRDPKNNRIKNFQVPLIKNNEIIERPADQNNITRRYSEETIKFIKKNKNKPFFIYLAHNLLTSHYLHPKRRWGKVHEVFTEMLLRKLITVLENFKHLKRRRSR